MERAQLLIDDFYCWGCQTCEVACKQENRVPDGIKLISIREELRVGADGKPEVFFRAGVCRHCKDAPCAEPCPVEAIVRRPDGIVILDETECTGCGACLVACPHDAITLDERAGVAYKCNLCFQRVDRGLLPACADNVCLAHCIHFQKGQSPAALPVR